MEERGCLGGLLHFKQKGKIEKEGCNEISHSPLQANFYPSSSSKCAPSLTSIKFLS